MKKDVLEPIVKLTYAGKDFTVEAAKALIEFTFTSCLEGESDSLEVLLEDADRHWQGPWYPQHGDELTAEIGYVKGDRAGRMLPCGTFEIDEAELAGPPDTLHIKALSAGVKRKLRSRNGKAYDDTSLADIAQQIADANGLELTGKIDDIKIMRVTQAHEQDLPFLKRLCDEYGHGFAVRGKKLCIDKRAELKKKDSVKTIKRVDVTAFRFVDKIKGVVESATVSYHDPLIKDTHVGEVQDDEGKKARHSKDALKINVKAEDPDQAKVKAAAAIEKANEDQTCANFTLMGDDELVAGVNVDLEGWASLDGKYQIHKAVHSAKRSSGYIVEIEAKRVRQ